ncbi:hypothetical protein KC332_g14452 [Hortaea werneckii]|nr:hypothetical protein KC358_g14460 [Hortaea werneckii]KAI6806198.1 hypothetical protein KC350_g14269 [Hortaea werneckii]KAI6906951.1 hypothetical protein KC348_g14447 [Hortaea werneckii]KAI6924218.1 hypothetical protein KC341_g14199 [Hortaea werneckii]KAI6957855.1 hypothetical protein KC321_g14348 [Hortaea werneckii]
MPFNWRLQVRLAITNFVVVFIGVLIMKILLTPIGAYLFPANTADLTSNDASLSANGSPQDHVNFSDEPVPTVSQEITIGGTPIAATTDAFGRLPDGGKYVELVDKGYSPMHIDLTDGLGELYQVVETVDGQVVFNETFRGEDAEKPTDAEYAFVINPLDGVIVAQSMFSPGKLSPNRFMPSLEKWSDVTWRCWILLRSYASANSLGYRVADFRGHLPPPDGSAPPPWLHEVPYPKDLEKPMAKWLNYIVIQNIQSPQETHKVISYCMEGWLDLDLSPKYVNGRVPLWNDDFTFEIGSACYNALLATSNCRGIAWFLTQHKERLGAKVPFSVKVWWPTDHGQPIPSIDMPSMLWEIRDASDPEVLREKGENDQKIDALNIDPV